MRIMLIHVDSFGAYARCMLQMFNGLFIMRCGSTRSLNVTLSQNAFHPGDGWQDGA